MKSKETHTCAQEGAPDTATKVVALRNARYGSALTIPPLKDRRKMQQYVWRRILGEVGLALFSDILADAVDQMLNDLERGNNDKASLSESDLFASDDSLTDLGFQYVEEAFENVITGDEPSVCDTLTGLVSALDKECFTYFKIERAAAQSNCVRQQAATAE